MANIIKNFLGYLKLNDDDEFEDEFEDEFDERELAKAEKKARADAERAERLQRAEKAANREEKKQKPVQTVRSIEADSPASEARKPRTRMERTTNNKIVPIRTTPLGLEVCIMKPATFEDSQDITDMLLTGRAVVVNLEGFDADDAQRIMDFISGAVYAINGKLHQISRYIFIFSPDTIDISGDYLELMPEEGFGVPTLNKEF